MEKTCDGMKVKSGFVVRLTRAQVRGLRSNADPSVVRHVPCRTESERTRWDPKDGDLC